MQQWKYNKNRHVKLFHSEYIDCESLAFMLHHWISNSKWQQRHRDRFIPTKSAPVPARMHIKNGDSSCKLIITMKKSKEEEEEVWKNQQKINTEKMCSFDSELLSFRTLYYVFFLSEWACCIRILYNLSVCILHTFFVFLIFFP